MGRQGETKRIRCPSSGCQCRSCECIKEAQPPRETSLVGLAHIYEVVGSRRDGQNASRECLIKGTKEEMVEFAYILRYGFTTQIHGQI